MQRGFIQIPILIAILLGIAILGGGSYIVSQKISERTKVVADSGLPVGTSTAQTASTTSEETKADARDSVIKSLQKEVANLTEKANQPKITQQTSPATSSVENVAKAEVVATTTNTFPCSKFSALTEDIWGITLQLIDMYGDDGTKENPSTGNFDYPYNKINAQKTTFYSNIDRLNQKIDLLSNYDGVSQAKTDLSKVADGFREAFDLKLQGYKLANNDAFVYVAGYKILPQSNIDQSRLDVNQAYSKYISALDSLSAGKKILDGIGASNSCNTSK